MGAGGRGRGGVRGPETGLAGDQNGAEKKNSGGGGRGRGRGGVRGASQPKRAGIIC